MRPLPSIRTSLSCLALVVFLSPALPTAQADVVTTTEGLVLEGEVQTLDTGWYRVKTSAGTVDLAPSAVTSVKRGDGPRAQLLAQQAKVPAKDARANYAFALVAEAGGQPDLAAQAYRRVLTLDPSHKAARRALGFELHQGAWLQANEVRERQGLVRYRGRWMLPAEVEAASRVKAAAPSLARAADVVLAHKLIAHLGRGDAVMANAARVALAKTDPALRLAGAKRALLDAEPKVRIAAARELGALGDESSLRALIFSGARDTNADVRRACVLAAASFGHDDTSVPFVRALGSENDRVVANAAQALAQLGDQRAAGYVVKRLTSHGSSSRNYVAFLNQVSYVRDYDVEIAQASNIANPDVARIQEGVILDIKVRDASFSKTWIEGVLVDSLSQLAGRPLRNKAEALDWYAENKGLLGDYPKKPKQRAPRRGRRGKLIGVPPIR